MKAFNEYSPRLSLHKPTVRSLYDTRNNRHTDACWLDWRHRTSQLLLRRRTVRCTYCPGLVTKASCVEFFYLGKMTSPLFPLIISSLSFSVSHYSYLIHQRVSRLSLLQSNVLRQISCLSSCPGAHLRFSYWGSWSSIGRLCYLVLEHPRRFSCQTTPTHWKRALTGCDQQSITQMSMARWVYFSQSTWTPAPFFCIHIHPYVYAPSVCPCAYWFRNQFWSYNHGAHRWQSREEGYTCKKSHAKALLLRCLLQFAASCCLRYQTPCRARCIVYSPDDACGRLFFPVTQFAYCKQCSTVPISSLSLALDLMIYTMCIWQERVHYSYFCPSVRSFNVTTILLNTFAGSIYL